MESLPRTELLFALLALLFFGLMLYWALAMMRRLLPEELPPDFAPDRTRARRAATDAGLAVPVGLWEIREDLRHGQHAPTVAHVGEYHGAELPDACRGELWDRRN